MLVFTLLGDDKAQGGYLKFPQLDVAVDLRKGDVLAFDADLLHANTPFKNKSFERLSCVFYDRILAETNVISILQECKTSVSASALQRQGCSVLGRAVGLSRHLLWS